MKKYKHTIGSVIFVGFVVTGMILLAAGGVKSGVGQTASLLGPVSDQEWTRGNPSTKLTLVEYSDFQCPACGSYYPIVEQLMSEFGDRMRLVYRNFPLRQIHENADLAARVAEAAGVQGKFWEMHDLLFGNQAKWSVVAFVANSVFEGFARSLGLDMKKFDSDRDSAAVVAKVEKDYQSGVAVGVNHTPTFFLNGKELPNPRSYEEFRNIILGALGKS